MAFVIVLLTLLAGGSLFSLGVLSLFKKKPVLGISLIVACVVVLVLVFSLVDLSSLPKMDAS
jgi:hypothetical protein